MTLPKPVGVRAGGGPQRPPSATGEVCDYHGQSFNVISYISQVSSHFPVAYASVSGVGDQARSLTAPLGGGKENEGAVATTGSTLVAITATATPASLTQIETLVNQLL